MSAESHLPAEIVASTEFCAAWSGKNRLFSFKAAPSKMKDTCVEKVCEEMVNSRFDGDTGLDRMVSAEGVLTRETVSWTTR